ncbi:MAG: 30S ribosomal protein S5 [Patescibacteria group bacterium]|jgi:small subunit ribosomal protein S5|nr:30S ribosomal protein S5 [Patescibacteria group bacterium]
MSEDKKTKAESSNKPNNSDSNAAKAVAASVYGDKKKEKGAFKKGRFKKNARKERQKDEFEQRILDIARVTRVMAGGKRMNFRATVGIGDRKGGVGVGVGKGSDVTIAVNKAVNRAKKEIVKVPLVNETIPHAITHKLGAAKIMLKPGSKGRGVISGGVVRTIMDLAGIPNITTKTLGTNNKLNNARCAVDALDHLKKVDVKEKKEDNKKNEEKNEVKSQDKDKNQDKSKNTEDNKSSK